MLHPGARGAGAMPRPDGDTGGAMNQWTSKASAAWVAGELGLPSTVAAAVAEEFEAKDIEGDGLLGNMKRVEKVLAQLVDGDAAVAIATLCAARDGMHASAFFANTPRPTDDWAGILAGPDEAEIQASLQGAVDGWKGGRWVLSKHLGQGGSGLVLAAEDTRLGRVAIKFTHSEDPSKAEREAALMQRVAHEHVCRLFEHAMIAGSLHAMVLELLTMGSLEDLRNRSVDGRVREFECVRMASHILSALSFMHSKDVIHRDLKPSNIMLSEGSEGRAVFKLIDLSVSAIELTAQGQVSDTLATNTTGLQAQVGSPHYMSPEQITAGVGVTPQTDLWSLGVVLFECLSGVKPFAPDDSDGFKIAYAVVNTDAPMLQDVIAEVGVVGDKMAAFVSHSLRKDRADRFETAEAMTEALEAALSASADEEFALFISYRVWCDKEFAQALFKATSATQLREGREHRMNVYLDKVRLLDGQRFDVGFIKGLASSTVFAPLMTLDCMKSFADLEQTDKEDFVLMEWIVAIELQKRGIVKAIFPIAMGQQSSDGKYDQFFFEKLLQGEVDGRPLPDTVSKKTTEKAREFLGMLDEPVELSQELTVKEVVKTILSFQAILLHFENDAIDKQTGGRVRQGSVTMRESHGQDSQIIAQDHVIAICSERIAKVVQSFQPARQPEPKPAPGPAPGPGSIFSEPGGFTMALDVPDYDTLNVPEGMVAQIKEAEDNRIRKLRWYKGCCRLICGALMLCLLVLTIEVERKNGSIYNRWLDSREDLDILTPPPPYNPCDGYDCGHGICSGNKSCTCTSGWSGSTCSTKVSCGSAPSPPLSICTRCSGWGACSSSKEFGDSCTATCDHRFYSGGSATFTCGADGHYNGSLSCEARVLTPVGAGPFPGSQLITPEWGETLSEWTSSSVPEGAWTLCYSSFTDDATSPTVFHSQCDAYSATVSVARNAGEQSTDPEETNAGNFTFGGFAVGSFNKEVCCEDPLNDCTTNITICTDRSSSQDFLFGLWMPGGKGPQRFLPTGNDIRYQYVSSDRWPEWGGGSKIELRVGQQNGHLGGAFGACNPLTFAGSDDEICGGGGNWGATQLEVWRPACTTCGGHGTCDPSTRVCACAAGYKLSNPATCVVDPEYVDACNPHCGDGSTCFQCTGGGNACCSVEQGYSGCSLDDGFTTCTRRGDANTCDPDTCGPGSSCFQCSEGGQQCCTSRIFCCL